MEFEYNKDQATRDKILFGRDQGKNNYLRYTGLSYDDLQKLVEEKFADPEERQNDSPSILEFLGELKEFKDNVTFHGYAISLDRDDYRVSVEGFEIEGISQAQLISLMEQYRFADELTADAAKGYLYTWWD